LSKLVCAHQRVYGQCGSQADMKGGGIGAAPSRSTFMRRPHQCEVRK